MSLKVAEMEDLPIVLEMAMKFVKNTPYKDHASEVSIRDLITTLILDDDKIIILYDNIGMIAGIRSKFILGKSFIATEIAWWVEPNERGKDAGEELLKAFEFWAKRMGCSLLTMVSLDDSVGKYYERKGFSLCEHVYMKEI